MNNLVILPEAVLLIWALLLATVWKDRVDLSLTSGFFKAAFGAVIAVVLLSVVGIGGINPLFFNDSMAMFFKFMILASLMFTVLSFGTSRQWTGTTLSTLYITSFGCMIVAGGNEYATLFAGAIIAILGLTAFLWLASTNTIEKTATRKWFSVQIVSLATLAFGLSLVYGLSATTHVVQSKVNMAIVHLTQENIGVILAIAEVALLVGVAGLLFIPPLAGKLACEASDRMHPSIVVFRLSVTITLGMLLFAKIFDNGLSAFQGSEMNPNDWGILATVFASAAMTLAPVFALKSTDLTSTTVWLAVGQLGAIWQSWIWLTEQSIVVAGFLHAALLIALFSLAAVTAIVRRQSSTTGSESFAGLWHRSPLLGAIGIAGLLSLVGFPATIGYNARFMWFDSSIAASARGSIGIWAYVAIGACAVSTLVTLAAIVPWVKKIVAVGPDTSEIQWHGTQRVVAITTVVAIIALGLFAEPLYKAASGLPIAFGFLAR